MKKQKVLTVFIVIAILVVSLCGCESRELTPTYPLMRETISLANEEMTEFWTNYTRTCSQELSTGKDKYVMKGVEFAWDYNGPADYYELHVSDSKTMEDPIVVTSLGKTAQVDDLYPGSTYYWQVIAVSGETKFISDIFSFKTLSTMKTIYIDGVTNTRNIGGVKVKGGKTIKYDLIFRGANLDGITTSGKYVFSEVYGIKTDLDLRAEGEGTAGNGKGSPAGENINYINISGAMYQQISYEKYAETIAEEFRVFTKEENYPIYFHCAIGRDRTGTLAFVLGAVLGMSEDDLFREYETSGFSRYGGDDMEGLVNDNLGALVSSLESYEGKTINDKVVSLLKSVGITDDEIEAVRNICLE